MLTTIPQKRAMKNMDKRKVAIQETILFQNKIVEKWSMPKILEFFKPGQSEVKASAMLPAQFKHV